MTSTLSPTAYSEDLWLTEPSVDPNIRQAGLKGEQPSLGSRVARGLRRFLIIFCMGVGSTLAWHSYGDQAREMIAKSSPQLGWLGPQTAAFAEAAPELVATPPPANSPDWEALKAMSLDLAALRQSMDELAAQFAASQQQMASDIAKLRAAEQDISDKISSAPSARPAAAPARKPAPVPAQPPQEPSGR